MIRLDAPKLELAYDANGNTLTDVQGRQFTWDFENRLVQAVVPGTSGGATIFKYDPCGRRIQKSGPLPPLSTSSMELPPSIEVIRGAEPPSDLIAVPARSGVRFS